MNSEFVVLPDDYGIRPITKAEGCCTYCQRKIGEPHKSDCVIIVRETRYAVFLIDCEPKRRIGTWWMTDPADWTADDCDFSKNDGGWCASNVLDSGRYEGEPLPVPNEDEGECLCSKLLFECEERAPERTRARRGE